MSKKPIMGKKTQDAVTDLLFTPSMAQRKVKAAFWIIHNENPIISKDKINMAYIIQQVDDGRIRNWWGVPGFQDWFLNKEEVRQRIEYLFDVAMDQAEVMLLDQSTQPSAKVNLIKLLSELADKMPAKSKEIKFLDASIEKMDAAQLDEYIKKQAALGMGEDKIHMPREDKIDMPGENSEKD